MKIINIISKSLNLTSLYLERLVHKAPYSYKKYTIPKRTGGVREIHHPRAELKVIQRWIVENIISTLPVHEAVHSYVVGRNIRGHAAKHVRNNFLMRLDIQDFFPSIKARDVELLLAKNMEKLNFELDADDFKIISRIVCRKMGERLLVLTIGAPSSPAISNAILYEFDNKIAQYCELNGITYTRYADDLYFSTNKPDILGSTANEVRKLLKRMKSPAFLLNEEKTVFTSKKRKRIVTGVVLTSDQKLSIGRDSKRAIRTEIYLALKNDYPKEKLANLRGRLAYYQSVEPSFIESLRNKFGAECIHQFIHGK